MTCQNENNKVKFVFGCFPSETMEVSSFTKLENEAQEKAAKYVANMLHTPDKLEKVHQMKWNVTRKKASVEAMLKTAMQSQLDGVKTGLGRLETALSEMKDIKTRYENPENQGFTLHNGF